VLVFLGAVKYAFCACPVHAAEDGLKRFNKIKMQKGRMKEERKEGREEKRK